MPPKSSGFNPFSGLASLKTKLATDEATKEKEEKIKQEMKAKKAQNAFFERALKGKFQDFPPANYETQLPGVRSITVSQTLDGMDFLPVILTYQREDGRDARASFQILKDGILSGDRIPKELSSLTKQNIIDEVARIAETIGVGMWHKLDMDILPDSDRQDDEYFGEKITETRPNNEKGKIDPERLRFLSKQAGFLFGVVSKDWGFTSRGYEIGFFSKCMVFENHEKGNAAFVLSLGEEVELNEEMQKRAYKGKIMNKDDAQSLANRYIRPIISEATTRRKLVEIFQAKRIVHAGDVWQDKMRETIEEFQNEVYPVEQ